MQKTQPRIGITGNIGSGKSTVCRIFQTLKIPVFYADIEAKMLYYTDEIKQMVRNAFGDEVFKDDEVNFALLGKTVFGNAEKLQQLNEIIHPAVMERYNRWLDFHAGAPYTLHEAAVLFEHGLEIHFDRTICVSAPEHIRLQRVMKRDGVNEEDVKKRMQHQWSDQKKEAAADFVINNDGTVFLIPQIMKIHKELLNLTL